LEGLESVKRVLGKSRKVERVEDRGSGLGISNREEGIGVEGIEMELMRKRILNRWGIKCLRRMIWNWLACVSRSFGEIGLRISRFGSLLIRSHSRNICYTFMKNDFVD
jgi:hypothetical protein